MKYAIFTFLMTAAFALAITPTARTLDPFWNDFADAQCDKYHMNALRGFAILGNIFAGTGFFLGIAGLAGKRFKVPSGVFAILAFVFSIPTWAVAAWHWDDKFKCFLPNFQPDYLAMWVCTTGLSLIAAIIMFAIAEPAEGEAAPADAGKVEDAPQVKAGDDHKQTPQPEDEEAAKKKKADEEAAAAKKKADDEAAAKKKADEEAAAKKKGDDDAAAKKKAADEEAAKKKAADEEAAKKKAADEEAAKKKKADEDAAAAKKKADDEAAAKKKADDEAAAKKKAADDAAAAKKKADEEAAAHAKKKLVVDWKAVNAKLPYDKKNPEQKKKRFEMFDQIDVNKTGKVSLAEVSAGMERVLQLPAEVHVPVVVKTAFDKAKVAGQQAGVNADASGGDFIEKNEFRLFLMYMRMYFEMFQLFSALDESGDMCIEIGEFTKAIPLLTSWGAKITNPAATFAEIDKNGGGKVLFDEFVDWALSPEQNLDCPDDDE